MRHAPPPKQRIKSNQGSRSGGGDCQRRGQPHWAAWRGGRNIVGRGRRACSTCRRCRRRAGSAGVGRRTGGVPVWQFAGLEPQPSRAHGAAWCAANEGTSGSASCERSRRSRPAGRGRSVATSRAARDVRTPLLRRRCAPAITTDAACASQSDKYPSGQCDPWGIARVRSPQR